MNKLKFALCICLAGSALVTPLMAQNITTIAGCGIGDDSLALSAELMHPQSIAVDNVGNVYIAEAYGNRIRKVGTSGIITTIAGVDSGGYSGDGGPATAAALNYPSGIAIDNSHNIYIADCYNSRIRKIDPSGNISTVAGSGTPGYNMDGIAATTAMLNYPAGVSVDGLGNVYIADWANHRVRMVTASGIISTIAGTGVAGYTGDGIPATATELSLPTCVVVDNAGNKYVADAGNYRIRKINASGIIGTIAGDGISGFGGDGGPATDAEIGITYLGVRFIGIALDNSGSVYFSDIGNYCVRKIDPSGVINTIAGNGVADYGGDGGPASSAILSEPAGVAFDLSGNLLFTDTYNNLVRSISPSGVINRFAGQVGLFEDNIMATKAELSAPGKIAADTSGNIYFNDANNSRIRKINVASGTITTVAGKGVYGNVGDGGPATAAEVYAPAGIALDKSGNIYYGDSYAAIRKISTSGIITTIAGNGMSAFSGDGGPATAAGLYSPSGIVADAIGNIIIADNGDHRIRKIGISGIINTIAGNGTPGFSGDGGPAITAGISYPSDVAIDPSGNVYICDAGNYRVRKIDASGIITTIAGNGTMGAGGDGGPATAAQIVPVGIQTDDLGNIYIADAFNNRIRMIAPSGIITTIAGNGTKGFSGDGGPANAAQLNKPADVAIDRSGNIYIADGNNYRIRKINGTLGVPTITSSVPWNVTVYPNPATDLLNITTTRTPTEGTIIMYDIVGREMIREPFITGTQTLTIAGFTSGMYLLRVVTKDGETKNIQVIKE